MDGDAPVERLAVGVAEIDCVLVGLGVRVRNAVPVGDDVIVALGVGVGVFEVDAVTVPGALGEVLALAPLLRLAVAVPAEGVVETEGAIVLDCVPVGVAVGVPVGLIVDDDDGVCVGVVENDAAMLPVIDADEPREREAVGLAVSVVDDVGDGVDRADGVPVDVGVTVADGVADAVAVVLGVWESVTVDDGEADGVDVGLDVIEALEPSERELVGETETVDDGVDVAVTLAVVVADPVLALL